MGKKKEVIKLVPFTLKEISTFNKLKTAMELPYIFSAVPNYRGGYSHIRVKDSEPFDKEIINRLINEYRKSYNENLVFESNGMIGAFFVGNFQKIAE